MAPYSSSGLFHVSGGLQIALRSSHLHPPPWAEIPTVQLSIHPIWRGWTSSGALQIVGVNNVFSDVSDVL